MTRGVILKSGRPSPAVARGGAQKFQSIPLAAVSQIYLKPNRVTHSSYDALPESSNAKLPARSGEPWNFPAKSSCLHGRLARRTDGQRRQRIFFADRDRCKRIALLRTTALPPPSFPPFLIEVDIHALKHVSRILTQTKVVVIEENGRSIQY